MSAGLKNALEWHMQQHGTRVVDLVKGSGVTRSVVNKLLRDENGTTGAENALAIAAFYGKTLEQFIRCENVADLARLEALFALLTPDERRQFEAQIQGVLAARASQ